MEIVCLTIHTAFVLGPFLTPAILVLTKTRTFYPITAWKSSLPDPRRRAGNNEGLSIHAQRKSTDRVHALARSKITHPVTVRDFRCSAKELYVLASSRQLGLHSQTYKWL